MRKYLAILAAVLLVGAAFFLPGQLSAWNDRLLLDEVHIWQEEEREGFAESVQLTVAEKLLLMRGGTLDILGLGEGEALQGTYNWEEKTVSILVGETDSEPSESKFYSFQTEDAADGGKSEETPYKWRSRLKSVQGELRTLQALGGLPSLWSADSEVSYSGYGELLYIDRTTQVSFQVYSMSLESAPYFLDLTVDAQSGRILSFYLRKQKTESFSWGLRGASNFGAAWRDYWGLDSVNGGWYTEYTKGILENMKEIFQRDGPYNANAQIAFLYDGQALNIPLVNWVYSDKEMFLAWNS